MIFEDTEQNKASFSIVFEKVWGQWIIKAVILVSEGYEFDSRTCFLGSINQSQNQQGKDLLTIIEGQWILCNSLW